MLLTAEFEFDMLSAVFWEALCDAEDSDFWFMDVLSDDSEAYALE
jgi:hypothetical protein